MQPNDRAFQTQQHLDAHVFVQRLQTQPTRFGAQMPQHTFVWYTCVKKHHLKLKAYVWKVFKAMRRISRRFFLPGRRERL